MIVDLHAHSSPRSSCSKASLADLVASAREHGADAICLTEHDVMWPEEELAAASREVGMTIFCGVELSTDVGHVLAYGRLERPLWSKYRLEQLVAEAERGLVALVLPHPVRYDVGARAARAGRTPPAAADVAGRLAWTAVHAIECGSTQTTADEQALTAESLTAVPRPAVAGSDAHAPRRAGAWATEFAEEVRTVEDLVTELRAGRVRPSRAGSPERSGPGPGGSHTPDR